MNYRPRCPRCKQEAMHREQIRNKLSRRDNKTYICSPCGTSEAMYDFNVVRMHADESAWLKEAKG